jgi:hypothetical protein
LFFSFGIHHHCCHRLLLRLLHHHHPHLLLLGIKVSHYVSLSLSYLSIVINSFQQLTNEP